MKGRITVLCSAWCEGWLVFFLHCIFSYCFFNKWDERAAVVTLFVLFHSSEVYSPLVFVLTTALYYLPSNMLVFEGTIFG